MKPTRILFLTQYHYFSHMMVKSMLYVTFENKLFLESYILHAKYRIFHKKYMINTHLISRPEKVCIFMITKTHNWSVLVKLKRMVIIRIV